MFFFRRPGLAAKLRCYVQAGEVHHAEQEHYATSTLARTATLVSSIECSLKGIWLFFTRQVRYEALHFWPAEYNCTYLSRLCRSSTIGRGCKQSERRRHSFVSLRAENASLRDGG